MMNSSLSEPKNLVKNCSRKEIGSQTQTRRQPKAGLIIMESRAQSQYSSLCSSLEFAVWVLRFVTSLFYYIVFFLLLPLPSSASYSKRSETWREITTKRIRQDIIPLEKCYAKKNKKTRQDAQTAFPSSLLDKSIRFSKQERRKYFWSSCHSIHCNWKMWSGILLRLSVRVLASSVSDVILLGFYVLECLIKKRHASDRREE